MDVPVTYREGPPVDPLQLGALFHLVGFSRRRDAEHVEAMVAGSRWVVSAWVGDHLVGFARALSDGVSNGLISAVAVLPDWQRRGIGTEMMRRLLAGKDGVKFVLHTSEAGERLYRSMGFLDAPAMLVRPRISES